MSVNKKYDTVPAQCKYFTLSINTNVGVLDNTQLLPNAKPTYIQTPYLSCHNLLRSIPSPIIPILLFLPLTLPMSSPLWFPKQPTRPPSHAIDSSE